VVKARNIAWITIAGVSALAACGDAQGAADEQAETLGAASAANNSPGGSTEQPPGHDLITAARGATLVSATYNAADALALIDGDDESSWNALKRRNPAPYVFVVELMAPAVLASVGIDGSGERPGGVVGASAGPVLIEGSNSSADDGYRELARIDAAAEGETLAALKGEEPVRWLRFTVENSGNPEAAYVYLDELVAHGTLGPVAEEGRFSGVFQTGRVNYIRLAQDGLLISGCYIENSGRSSGRISGSVVDGVALVNWRSDQGIDGTALLTRNAQGNLGGVRYRQRSRTAWGGPLVETPDETIRCEDESTANPVAQALAEDGVARLYGIQFAFDSDVPKPSARAALDQLFEALSADDSLIVTIEGHTDAEGSDSYNANLSQRRAEAVVAHLTGRGIDPARLTAQGKGEAEPVASNDTADGRALNRRVEVRRTG
jgi:outer membrane protein OmpA-like peptidoglycan-associated protein